MQLLTNTLVIVLLSTTASAKSIGWPRHHDADIADNDLMQGWLHGNNGWFLRSSESSSQEDSSSESQQSSSESSESDSSESSEEVQTTPVVITTAVTTTAETTAAGTTAAETTAAETTIATEAGGTPTFEPDTMSTDGPMETASTPPPATPSTPPPATPECGTECFTAVIPTEGPTTENRGDN